MGRASTQIVIFLVILNAVAGMITASGVGTALDINPEVLGEEEISAAEENASTINPSQGTRDTLFGMFTSLGDVAKSIFTVVFYGPMMLNSLGIPIWLTTPIFAPATIIVAMDLIHLLTGRDP